MNITLEEVAMLVECPTCGACEIGSDSVEACWSEDGQTTEPVHDDRLDAAEEHLARARSAIGESRS